MFPLTISLYFANILNYWQLELRALDQLKMQNDAGFVFTHIIYLTKLFHKYIKLQYQAYPSLILELRTLGKYLTLLGNLFQEHVSTD